MKLHWIHKVVQYTLQNKELKTYIIETPSIDPWYNLALEEYLVKNVKRNEIYLYLWQNKETVVIGRNQNPWKECRCKILEDKGGKLARRLSGGGTVYHDLGNLNFTFIMDKKIYDLQRQLEVIIDTAKEVGIDAIFSGRNDITVKGKKFSGNAYYFNDLAAYHHGTILVDSDFEKLIKYLQVSNEKIISKGIDSVRSRVINLKEINPQLTIEQLKESIKKTFVDIYGGKGDPVNIDSIKEIQKLYDKYASWEWRYGETPKFDLILSNRFSWGNIEIGLELNNGHILDSKIYSDSLEVNLIKAIASRLNNIPLKIDVMINKINNLEDRNESERILIQDICRWLKTKAGEF